MDINADQLLENALRDGLREGVKQKLTSGYNSPIDKLVSLAIEKHQSQLVELLSTAISSALIQQSSAKTLTLRCASKWLKH